MNKKRLISMLVAMVICVVTLSGCSNVGKWIAKSADETVEVPVGVYIYNLNSTYYSACYMVEDYTKSPIGQKVKIDDEEFDASDWIVTQSIEAVEKYLAIEELCADNEIALTDSEASTLASSSASTYEASKDGFDKLGISKESVEYMFKASELSKKLFNSIYGEGGSEAVATKDLQKFFEEEYISIKYLPVSLVDADNKALAQEDKDKIKKDLQAHLDDYLDGKTFSEIEANYNADHKNSEVKTVSKIGQADNLGLGEDLLKEAKDLKAGDGTVVTVGNTMYLLVKYDVTLEKDYVEENKATLLSELKGEEFDTMVANYAKENLEYTKNSDAVNKYSPKWIDSLSK